MLVGATLWNTVREPEFLSLALILYYTWGTTLPGLEQRKPAEAGITASIWYATLHYHKFYKSLFPKQFSGHCLNWVHSDSMQSLSYIGISHNSKGPWIFRVPDWDTWEECSLRTQLIMHVCIFWNQLTGRPVGFLFTLKHAKGALSNSHFLCQDISF